MFAVKNHLVCDTTLQQPEMSKAGTDVVTSAWGSSKHHREILSLRLLLPGTVGYSNTGSVWLAQGTRTGCSGFLYAPRIRN